MLRVCSETRIRGAGRLSSEGTAQNSSCIFVRGGELWDPGRPAPGLTGAGSGGR